MTDDKQCERRVAMRRLRDMYCAYTDTGGKLSFGSWHRIICPQSVAIEDGEGNLFAVGDEGRETPGTTISV